MSKPSQSTFLISVPGTDQTRELSRHDLLEELGKGTVRSDYWVWSVTDNDWKQISEMPELREEKMPEKIMFVAPEKIAPLPMSSMPIRQKEQKKKKRKVSSRPHRVHHSDEGIPYFKILFGLLYAAVFAVIGFNYWMVDKPLDSSLAKTPFVLVPVHAHLGSFVQPDAMVFHILPNAELNQNNFSDFIYTLAKDTPQPPFGKALQTVTFTHSWFCEYALRGEDWLELGRMKNATATQRRNFFLDHLCNIAGELRISAAKADDDPDSARTALWQEILQKFGPHS